MADFDGKIVVVTGAAGGIGSAISRRFAREGAHVISVDKNEEWLKQSGLCQSSPGSSKRSVLLAITASEH